MNSYFLVAFFTPAQWFFLFLAVIILPTISAYFLNMSRFNKIKAGYKWGYFLSISHAFWAVLSIYLLHVFRNEYDSSNASTNVIFLVVQFISSLWLLKQTRFGWVMFTFLSLSPVLWIINYGYGKHRWNELSPRASTLEWLRSLVKTKQQRTAIISLVLAVLTIVLQMAVYKASGGKLDRFSVCLDDTYCRYWLSSALFIVSIAWVVISVLGLFIGSRALKLYQSALAWIRQGA